MPEIVYVLTNEAMPGLVKIGITTDTVEARLTQLSSPSGVPLPFECHFAAEVEDSKQIEKILHQLFAEHRINPRREFFRLDKEKAVLAISIGKFKEITPGKAEVEPGALEALEKAKAKRPKLRLDKIGINPRDVLTLSRDESIQAIVAPNNKLQYDGELLNPSPAALKALHKLGYKTLSASGSEYWMFEGETLDERRRRLESEQFDEAGTTPSEQQSSLN